LLHTIATHHCFAPLLHTIAKQPLPNNHGPTPFPRVAQKQSIARVIQELHRDKERRIDMPDFPHSR
jgi:hypothetical protein